MEDIKHWGFTNRQNMDTDRRYSIDAASNHIFNDLHINHNIYPCALGSFTDCLAGRMLNGTSVLKGRSHCDACGHVLGVLDLVPLFSRLCLRGRCRYCGAKIPAEAFWTEFVSGIACCLIMYRYDVSVLALRGILLWMVLLCLTLTDLHAWIIPDRLQIAGILIFFGTALGLPEPGRQMLRGVLTGAGLAVSMLALSLLFDRLTGKESLGGGDVKLFFVTGLYMRSAWEVLFFLILSCVLGIAGSVIGRREKIPFGPAIAAACFCMLLYGDIWTQWYTGLF